MKTQKKCTYCMEEAGDLRDGEMATLNECTCRTPTPQERIKEALETIFRPKSFRCVGCGLNSPSYCKCARPKIDVESRAKQALLSEHEASYEEGKRAGMEEAKKQSWCQRCQMSAVLLEPDRGEEEEKYKDGCKVESDIGKGHTYLPGC